MEIDIPLIRFSALSALIGFGVFCALQSYQVWRRRNDAVARAKGRAGGLAGRVGGWSACLLVVGVLGVAGALALREVRQPEGTLRGDGLFIVRSSDDGEATFLAEPGDVAQGEVVARFHSPSLEAKAEEARLQVERLHAEKQVLTLQPLSLDSELVRRCQNAATHFEQLQASLYQLLPAHGGATRELLADCLTRSEQIAHLENELNLCRREEEQAQTRKENSQQVLNREQTLYQRHAASAAEVEERESDARVSETEVVKLQNRLENLRLERDKYEESLSRLQNLADDQGGLLGREIVRTRQEMAEALRAKEDYGARLAADEDRARRLRTEELHRLDAQTAEAEAEGAGLRQRLAVTAPFAGRVAYRAPSPRAARRQQALLVLSPASGFRVAVRLPKDQAEALRQTGPIPLEAGAGLERRFSGAFLQAHDLPQEPGMSVAELECQPPAETVQALADEQDKATVQLLWRPPLTSLLPFQVGVLAGLVGAIGWGACRFLAKPVAASSASGDAPPAHASSPNGPRPAVVWEQANAVAPAAAGPTEVEFGRQGRLIRVLGVRLREALLRGEVQGEDLSAMEWALDRHHTRAVRLLAEGLCYDAELARCIGRLLGRLGADDDAARELADRLAAVLRVIVPEAVSGAA